MVKPLCLKNSHGLFWRLGMHYRLKGVLKNRDDGEVKLSLSLIKQHAVQPCRRVEAQLHILNFSIDASNEEGMWKRTSVSDQFFWTSSYLAADLGQKWLVASGCSVQREQGM
jgi:hypothetical protein